jgi:hypothetical protein
VAGVTTSLFVFLLLLLYVVSASQIMGYFSHEICVLTISATWFQAVAMVNASSRCGCCGQCNSFVFLFQHHRPQNV